MKKTILWLLLLSATSQHCMDEGQDMNPVTIQFTCLLPVQGTEGGRQKSVEPTTLRISLEDNDGTPLFTLKEIQLLKFGDAYITEPIELLQGYYRITDFLLVAGNQVHYATPKQNSLLSQTVTSPLPHGLWVSKNKSLIVSMDVIDVTQRLPADFGYASFFINVVNSFEVAVFTTTAQGYSLTDAKVRILKNDAVVKLSVGLPAEWTTNFQTRQIFFPGNPDDTYLLEVEKQGYATYRQWFVPNELSSELNNIPLKVFLVPSLFTMLAYVDELSSDDFIFEISLTGEPGALSFNWGDGTSTAHALSANRSTILHTYSAAGNYSISVTGDLNKITGLFIPYGLGRADELNVQGLNLLRTINLGLSSRSPELIDLTHNYNLESILFVNLGNLKDVILPSGGKYSLVSLHGPNQISTTSIDQIINALHQSVIRNPRSGHFALAKEWYNEFDTMIGPPSAAAIQKLRALRDAYRWEIRPDPL